LPLSTRAWSQLSFKQRMAQWNELAWYVSLKCVILFLTFCSSGVRVLIQRTADSFMDANRGRSRPHAWVAHGPTSELPAQPTRSIGSWKTQLGLQTTGA
jgi:hypothetical protein